MNIFFWAIWWFSSGKHVGFYKFPWPVWASVGWGLALAYQYFDAYFGSAKSLTEHEYEKLKRQQNTF